MAKCLCSEHFVFFAGVKSLKIKILRNIPLNVVLCWCGTDITCLSVNLRTGCRELGTLRSGDLCAVCFVFLTKFCESYLIRKDRVY
jgi:hypothetical protein